ncbi:MAG: rubrerythrin family protein [Deltaproteobacteria bacterium]|nr:rubrerythrin family protein [Deltaproteobacteria bacterium]
MDMNFGALVDESISLELNMASLYLVFHKLFPEDADFWWTLVLEEKNHAALIRSGKDSFMAVDKFPSDLISENLQELKDTNGRIALFLKRCEVDPPSREEAFGLALELERSAGELHFQEFMEKEAGSKIDEIFRQLNKDDKDHEQRIRSYMESNGIRLRTGEDGVLFSG